jgi:hypothetical protein
VTLDATIQPDGEAFSYYQRCGNIIEVTYTELEEFEIQTVNLSTCGIVLGRLTNLTSFFACEHHSQNHEIDGVNYCCEYIYFYFQSFLLKSDVSIVECAPGTYWSAEMESCELCPIGTYKNNTGNDECMPCPEMTSTFSPGPKYESQCAGM